MKLALAAGAFLLSGCGERAIEPASPRSGSAPVPRHATPPDLPRLADLAAVQGVWRLAGSEPPLLVSFVRGELRAVSGCVRWAWTFRFEGESALFRRIPSASPPCLRPLNLQERRSEELAPRTRFLLAGPGGVIFLWSETGQLRLVRAAR